MTHGLFLFTVLTDNRLPLPLDILTVVACCDKDDGKIELYLFFLSVWPFLLLSIQVLAVLEFLLDCDGNPNIIFSLFLLFIPPTIIQNQDPTTPRIIFIPIINHCYHQYLILNGDGSNLNIHSSKSNESPSFIGTFLYWGYIHGIFPRGDCIWLFGGIHSHCVLGGVTTGHNGGHKNAGQAIYFQSLIDGCSLYMVGH